jgi:hypothetical protein
MGNDALLLRVAGNGEDSGQWSPPCPLLVPSLTRCAILSLSSHLFATWFAHL